MGRARWFSVWEGIGAVADDEHAEGPRPADQLRGELIDAAILIMMGALALAVCAVVEAWKSWLGLAATAVIVAVLVLVVVRAVLAARRLARLAGNE